MIDDPEKWFEHVTGINSWKTKEERTFWSKDCDKHWKNLQSIEDHSINWPIAESGGESLMKSLIRTPIMRHNFPPPPPKPDSPPEVSYLDVDLFIFDI